MAITTNDVKLLKSQRLTDEDDGGGRATGQAVADAEINNLFPDISRLDRTMGRINLRKVFAGVISTNADAYLGAHSIVTQAPADPRVSVLLFNTGSQTDERSNARNAIEAYVVPAVSASFELLGNQLQGQRALAGVQREEQRIPEIGEVYQLVRNAVPAFTQYVRITEVETRLEQFTYDYGNGNFVTFTRRRLDLSISAPLGSTFPGGQVTPAGTTANSFDGLAKAQILTTQVADAARYYGISKLAESVALGSMSLKVNSVYSQLVPSSTRENALVDQLAGYQRRIVLAAGPARTLALTFGSVAAGVSRSFLGTGCAPGTLSLTANGGVFADDSKGGIRYLSGSNWISAGTVDYETGEINLTRVGAAWTGSGNATYQPGAPATDETVTGEIRIALSNRGFVYTLALGDAPPRPGTLVVSFLALGKWQEIRDPGNGELTGQGTGSISFATGSVSLTLNALPDAGSSLIYTYVGQNAAAITQRTGSAVAAKAKVTRSLPHDGVRPGSLVVTFKVGGVTKTLTDNGAGVLSGTGGSGTLAYASGVVQFIPSSTPDAGTGITYSYEQGDVVTTPLAASSDGAGVSIFTIPGAPLKPGSVQINWLTKRRQAAPALNGNATQAGNTLPVYETDVTVSNSVNDNGWGGWIGRTGVINYTTGVCSLQVATAYTFTEYTYTTTKSHGSWGADELELVATQTSKQETFPGTLEIHAQAAGASYGAETDTQPAPAITLELLPGIAEPIVPGSLVFTWGGETYVDRSGVLFKNVSSQTNAGTSVGSVDYASGKATLATFTPGAAADVALLACLTTNAGFQINAVTFRTPGAPLRSGSLQVTTVRADNAQLVTATADANGNFNHPVIKGTVDISTGIVRLQFTSNTADASGASNIPVIPVLTRYNAVMFSSLPLDASLIGLDPVRLPADGRVPIYREGDVLVIHHTGERLVASPAAGATVTLDRSLQAEISVVDESGRVLRASSYTADREAGTVTWANPLVLQDAAGNPLTLPLVIRDRVEHMTLCTEVQISGSLGISSPLPWALPAGETRVSSAVTWGDLQARIHHWFTQQTWNSSAPNWTDSPVGGSTTANYNQLSYPPIITNRGAIDGKWALVFTSNTAFNVVEEKLGVITTGSTASDCAPINPQTSEPYFTIRKEGWGGGWSAANVVRFNTDSALGPLWVVRTVLSGQGTVDDDQFKLQIRGDAD